MATWSRGLKDWDPMRDDYNDSMYDPQYADENIDSGVQLDHSKLYVTNIPQTLSEEGLKFAFTKYGNVIKIHMSRDPKKRYAFVFYESPSEAKLALMKLNKSEPLKLNIAVAHKKTYEQPAKVRSAHPSASYSNNYKDETSSLSSKGNQNTDSHIEMENMENTEDDESLSGVMNPDLNIEFTKLQLRELEVQRREIQFQKKLLLLNCGKKETNIHSNRTITADGKIIFKNTIDRPDTAVDATFSGAGDSLKVPGLQRASQPFCLACGGRGELFCAACGVAPYCSPKCQKSDWVKRHRTVCHNLARTPDQLEASQSEKEEPMHSDPKEITRNHRFSKHQRLQTQADEDSSGNTDSNRNNKRFERKPQISTRTSVPTSGPLRRPKCLDSDNIETQTDKPAPPEINDTEKLNVVRAPAADRRPNFRPGKGINNSQKSIGNDAHGTKGEAVQNGDLSQKVQGPKAKPNAQNSIQPPKEQVHKEKTQTAPVVIPKIEILPKMYIVATFEVGDTFVLSAEADAKDCLSRQKGFICIALNTSCEDKYNLLCNDYCTSCNAEPDTYTPRPGDLFSFNNREGGDSWFRARCLNSTSAALIDACEIASFAAGICKKIPSNYQDIPEFCCVLDADVSIGDSLLATVVTKLSCESVRVDLQNTSTNEKLGLATISRWSPAIELPIPSGNPIPQVPRPSIKNNSKVILVEASKLDAVYVRSADSNTARQFNGVVQDAILCAQKGAPLKEPPARGQVVIAKYKDGIFSRALVQRINALRTKYLLEYIEFGYVEPQTLETLYPCPDKLSLENQPTVVSCVTVSTEYPDITEPAKEYINKVRDQELELILTLADAQTAPSGSEVSLTLEKNKENFNRQVVEMCKPGWKVMEQKGTDVVELAPILYYEMDFVSVPSSGCEFIVLDIGTLFDGLLSGYPSDTPRASYILDNLPDLMAAYCNSDLGRDPYLPLTNEVCIAQLPPHEEWFRAVMLEQENGAGGTEAKVAYIDYGNIATVPVSVLRKMVPEFIKDIPGLASTVQIRDFPSSPTEAMVERALEYLQLDDLDRGRLTIKNCTKIGKNTYEVDAPGLIAMMKGKI
ncbi:uncharacterized protein LOC125061397 isoform X4 [Pieris napi]|uniref:uncharacterized protein LOC125061397 isoform X4 n=1 Tax=Pieris napi TaxID=78633 RepID=UPI001FBC06AE|nr:uncharacterized protein LOC125061397 isoform X4 [Pieris napi]